MEYLVQKKKRFVTKSLKRSVRKKSHNDEDFQQKNFLEMTDN